MIKEMSVVFRCQTGFLSLLVSTAILAGLLLSGCSSSDSDNQGMTLAVITKDKGGTYDGGPVSIDFPPDSVDFDVMVTGTVVEGISVPSDVTPLGDVYQIKLSHAEAYNADTAVISFDLDQNGEDIFVFHSSDGIDWNIIGGIFDENTLSASIPEFSYFFAGNMNPSRWQYAVTFYNHSYHNGSVCIYQYNPDVGSNEIVPLAWLVEFVPPGEHKNFRWSQAYSFWWSTTPWLQPGVVFKEVQYANADLSSLNRITFGTFEDWGGQKYYCLKNQTSGPSPGRLDIQMDGGIEADKASVAIGMSGLPIYATQAMPNCTAGFSPTPNKYWIAFTAFGYFKQGEVLDPEDIQYKAEIDFPAGVYSMIASFNLDLTWTIFPNTGQ